VYAYTSNPENLPQWAAGLGAGISRKGAHWEVDTPQGKVGLHFTPRNEYGVLDHTVKLPDGTRVYVPMRVLANGEGSEVVITLYRQPEMDDAAFERDAGMMQDDLARLKHVLES
jgi:hypothetical protein